MGRSVQRHGSPDNVRHRLPLDRHRLGSVADAIGRVGNHERDCIADMLCLIESQDGIRRDDDLGAGNFRLAGKIPEAARVCTGEDEATPGDLLAASTMRKRACACGERTTYACSRSGGAWSAT